MLNKRRTPNDESYADMLDKAFPPITLATLQKYKVDPSQHIAGDGWLRKGAGCLLVGGTGIGKSVLAEQIAVCVGAGIDIFGKIKVKRPQKVLYIGAENDTETLQRDFLSIIKHEKASLKHLKGNLRMRHVPGVPVEHFGEWLEKQVKMEEPDLVVIDPYQAYVGGADLNKSDSFLKWVGPVNEILATYEIGLLLVAHTPKPRDRDDWGSREMVYMVAGTSAASNWARTSCELIAMKHEGNRFQMHFAKNAERTGMQNSEGGVVRQIIIEHSGNIKTPFWKTSEDQTVPAHTNAKSLIVAMATECPEMSQGQLAVKLGLSKSTINQYYPKSLKKAKKANKDKAKKGRKR